MEEMGDIPERYPLPALAAQLGGRAPQGSTREEEKGRRRRRRRTMDILHCQETEESSVQRWKEEVKRREYKERELSEMKSVDVGGKKAKRENLCFPPLLNLILGFPKFETFLWRLRSLNSPPFLKKPSLLPPRCNFRITTRKGRRRRVHERSIYINTQRKRKLINFM